MDPDGLIAAFAALPSNDSRQKAIDGLLCQLTPYEWRNLHAATSARSFQFDIVGKLPVELVAHVFAHLAPATPFQLQHVSRRWHHVLSSLEVVKSNLAAWFGDARRFHEIAYVALKRIAQDVHAFRHGRRPHRAVVLNIRNHMVGSLILSEDTLIWTPPLHDSATRSLYILNIKTWTFRTLYGEARENLYDIFASDQLAGFTTRNNICYAFDLSSSERRKFRVPNFSMLQYLVCQGRMIACALPELDRITVFIWDYDMCRGTSFTISYDAYLFGSRQVLDNQASYSIRLLLQPIERTVIVFFDNYYHTDIPMRATVRYATFNFTGTRLRQSEVNFEGLVAVSLLPSEHSKPVDRQGTVQMHAYANLPSDSQDDPNGIMLSPISLQFNERSYRFTRIRTAPGNTLWTNEFTSWWKDTFFATASETTMDDLLPMSYCVFANVGTKDQAWFKPLARSFGESPVGSPYVNDKFVIIPIQSTGFLLMCYDSTIELPTENGEFFGIGKVEAIDSGAGGHGIGLC